MGEITRPGSRLFRICVGAALLGATLPVVALVGSADAATMTWDGGGANGNWSNALNWENDVAPSANDALVFPAGMAIVNRATNNDFPQGTAFASLTVEDGGYSFGGNGITTTTLTTTHASGQANFALGNGNPGIVVPAAQTLTVDVGAGGEVFDSMLIDLAGRPVVLDVDGTLHFFHGFVNTPGSIGTRNGSGVVEFTGGGPTPTVDWAIQSGTTYFKAAGTYGANVQQTGGTVSGYNAFIASYTGSGGTLTPGDAVIDAAQLSWQGNLAIGGGTTYRLDVVDVNTYDRMFVTGAVSLGGTLSVDAPGFVPTGGQTLTLINNDLADAVTGTFAGLAEGDPVAVNGGEMTISYAGGDGNDVTLSTPAAYVWDGEAADDNWTTAQNWVGDVAPPPNADATLEFPNATDKNVVNDFPAGTTFGDIVFSFADYVISGQQFGITGSVVSTAGAGFNTIAADVEFTQNGTIAIPNAGVQIRFTGDVLIDNGAVFLTGGGFTQASGSLTGGGGIVSSGPGGGAFLGGDLSGFFGTVTIDAGYVQVDGDLGLANVTVNTGGTLAGTGSVGRTDANGGTVQPTDTTPPGAILGVDEELHLLGPSKLSLDVDAITPGVGHDQLTVVGTVELAGTLELTAMAGPPIGQVLTIIDNDGVDAVTGTFAGLAEGATVTVNGIPMAISYIGGDGNDVTLSTTAFVWDGGAANDNWTSAQNWVGDVAPVPGPSVTLVFPDAAARKTNNNDFGGPTVVEDVLFTGSGYAMSGAALEVRGNVSATNTSGTNTMTMQLDLPNASTITQAAGGELITQSSLLIGANTITLAGDGTITVNGQITGPGDVDKTGAGLVTIPTSPTFNGTLTIGAGTLRLNGNIAAEVVVDGGALVGAGAIGGGITTNLSGAVAPGFTTEGVLTTSIFTSTSATASIGFDVNGTTPGVDQDQLDINGPVTVAGWLSVSSTLLPPTGQEIVLIDNDGADAVSGTFNGIPEGGSTLVNGSIEGIVSYVGGDGNDVTLIVPPRFVWDGGGADASWTTPANWVNDVAPTGNADEILTFPNGASRLNNTNVFPVDTTFAELEFTGSGYTLDGARLVLNDGVDATNVTGTNRLVIPIDMTGDIAFTQAAGGTLETDVLLLSGHTAVFAGAGVHEVDGAINGRIEVATVAGGRVDIASSLFDLNGQVLVTSGLLNLTDTLFNSSLAIDGGRVIGDGGAVGITANGGTLAPGDLGTAIFESTSAASLGVGSTIEVGLAGPTPGTGHDQLAVTGSVLLAATLDVDALAALVPGDDYVIIANDGADAVVGMFAGLADGAVITVGGTPLTIDYQGGDGNDVVLTAGPHARLATAAVAVAEGAPGASTPAALNVLLDHAVGGDVVVHAEITGGTATSGTDVSALNTNVTIPGGSTSAPVPLSVFGDDLVEPNETVQVTLTAVSGAAVIAPFVATVTITNDDAATVSVPDADIVIVEGGPGGTAVGLATTSQLLLQLDHPSSTGIGVRVATADGTATAPADYTAFDQVFTIPAGATSLVVPLTAVDDAIDEADETFTVRVLSATGASLTPVDLVVTLVDNDGPIPPPTTPPTGPTTPGTVDPGQLPSTGGSAAGPLAVAALLLAAGATLAIGAARRRRTA